MSALGEANLDGNDGAYCVYQSKAGKVEFDIFFPAGNTPKEVSATEDTVLGEGGGKSEPVKLAGATTRRSVWPCPASLPPPLLWSAEAKPSSTY